MGSSLETDFIPVKKREQNDVYDSKIECEGEDDRLDAQDKGSQEILPENRT